MKQKEQSTNTQCDQRDSEQPQRETKRHNEIQKRHKWSWREREKQHNWREM